MKTSPQRTRNERVLYTKVSQLYPSSPSEFSGGGQLALWRSGASETSRVSSIYGFTCGYIFNIEDSRYCYIYQVDMRADRRMFAGKLMQVGMQATQALKQIHDQCAARFIRHHRTRSLTPPLGLHQMATQSVRADCASER
jgi:hypothetical protein